MIKNRKLQTDQKSEQLQESDAYCPSVQNALLMEHKLQELLAQSQLKKIGIQTAQALIKILYEEIRSLKDHNETLESQIAQMLRQSSQKEEHLKMQITFLQGHLRDVIEMRQDSRSSLSNCFLPSSSRKLQIPKSYKSTSKKSRHMQSPIKKMSLIETVSKQYVQNQYETCARAYQHVVSTLLSQQMQRMMIDFEDMDNLIVQEKEVLKYFQQKFQQNENQAAQLGKQLIQPLKQSNCTYQNTTISKFLSASKSNNKKVLSKPKKLFSTQISNDVSPDRIKLLGCWEDRIKEESKADISVKSVIRQYEDIIQQYKEYSAYLKAYLCSCIGFISKQAEQLAEHNNLTYLDSEGLKDSQQSDCLSSDRANQFSNFPSSKIFEVIFGDILSIVQEKMDMGQQIRRQLQQQNKQLRSILDELVDNLKRSGIQGNSGPSQNQEHYLARSRNSPQGVVNSQSLRGQSKSLKRKENRKNPSHRTPYVHRVTLTDYKNYYEPDR